MGGNKPKGDVLMGNGGLLGTGGVPTVGTGPDGTEGKPVNVALTPGGTAPDGSAANPFYVIPTGSLGGFGPNPKFRNRRDRTVYKNGWI